MAEILIVEDHAPFRETLAETLTDEGYAVRQAANGVQYTFRTCETDTDVLEYFETWDEQAFADMYRGGASLWKVA